MCVSLGGSWENQVISSQELVLLLLLIHVLRQQKDLDQQASGFSVLARTCFLLHSCYVQCHVENQIRRKKDCVQSHDPWDENCRG